MFIDYLPVMIINLVAAFVMFAVYLVFFFEKDQKKVVPGFLMTGFVSTATGLHLSLTWPLPGSNNIPIGEMSILFGVLFLATGIAILRDWDLLTVSIYAFFAGLAAIVVGVRYVNLGMSKHPILSGVGFLLPGAGAMLTVPVYFLRRSKALRIIVALIILAAAAIWALTGYGAYWGHMESFGKWQPAPMR
jgi:putative membrane protein